MQTSLFCATQRMDGEIPDTAHNGGSSVRPCEG
jgi:hypothetical protein